MSKSQNLTLLLTQAKERRRKYSWMDAIKLYEKASEIAVKSNDFSEAAEILERLGFCCRRAATQTENLNSFLDFKKSAIKAYEEAAGYFEHEGKRARTHHCKAIITYINSRLTLSCTEKVALLDECWKQNERTLKAYEETGDGLGYGKACNDLLTCLFDRLQLTWDWLERERVTKNALDYGEKAIVILSKLGDDLELARAYCMTSLHYVFAVSYEREEEEVPPGGGSKKFRQKCLNYTQRALELSEKVGDSHLIGISNWLAGETQFIFTGDLELSLEYAKEMLRHGMKVKDNFLIGVASYELASCTRQMMITEEDVDKKREGYETVMKNAENAIHHLSLVSHDYWIAQTYHPYTESHTYLATDVETNLKQKRILLMKAVEVGRKGLKYAKQSGCPDAILFSFHALSKALYFLSTIEAKISDKRKKLEEASIHREESIKIAEQAFPFDYWDRGVYQNYLALIEAKLAEIETNKDKKKGLLEKAVSFMESCLKLCRKDLMESPLGWKFATLGWYHDWFGAILSQLHSLTGERKILNRAIEVYSSAAETYEKADLPSRVAEAYWQIARVQDALGEMPKGAKNFQLACKKYRDAAEKMPQLKAFYADYAVYMQAWNEIEKAKHHHAERQYGQAKEHYEKTADLHKSTERWSYLHLNYLAWARLEEAEDLSRKEQTEEARGIFQQAAGLFVEAEEIIKAKLETIEIRDEKKLAAELVEASDARREYCLGRIALEEAKILDRQGDHLASSKKYGSAAETLQKIAKAESEQSRRELQPIIYLCQAWEKMLMAEVKASSTLYGEAAELFKQAKKHTIDEPTSLLALANSSFCKALEAGTEFETTRDTAIYSTVKNHMQAANNYYLKAGFRNASEYTKATQRLFDAYIYMDNAKRETDPEKKARFYMMAEKVLQTSAGSYMKAKHPAKTEEVQRLLESVKEERQLAMSLTEVLHAPTITSATSSFSTPTPTHEQAVGLERFEHADIQANMILRVNEVRVGEDLNIEIELVNAGKAPALLIKVEEIIPEDFEIKRAPEIYRVEDRYLNMKGKRLGPLKTEDVKLVLRPATKGTFILKPRIMYLDETGKYKSHEPESVTITVKEMGIKGWIKGER